MNICQIRTAKIEDVTKIAEIHKKQFANHFLGHYSTEVIGKFYMNFLNQSIFLVSEENGIINGFVMGGYDCAMVNAKKNFR